jgi:hypothetical protein
MPTFISVEVTGLGNDGQEEIKDKENKENKENKEKDKEKGV